MMRRLTLVSAFAAMAMVTWAQPTPRTNEQQTPQNERRLRRPDVQRLKNQAGDTARQARDAVRRGPQTGDNERPDIQSRKTPQAGDQLVRPGQANPAPTNDETNAAEKSQPVSPRSKTTAPRDIKEPARINAEQNNVHDRKAPTPGDDAQPAKPNAESQPPALAPKIRTTPSSTHIPSAIRNRETPVAPPATDNTNSSKAEQTPSVSATPDIKTPSVPNKDILPAQNETPSTPSTPASEKKTPVAPPANATPFVPKDMPDNLRDSKNPTPAVSPKATGTPSVKSTPTTDNALKPVNTPATEPTPNPEKPAATSTPAPTPTPSPKQQAERKQHRAELKAKRENQPAISADKVTSGDLNQAASRFFNKGKNVRKDKNPADVKLTPWIEPKVASEPGAVNTGTKNGEVTLPPPGATPTPTPAPERIRVKDRATILDNIRKTTLAPPPPPAPTPGATPVPTPPGVTPVPADFQPKRGWTPYPGWRPPHNWHPPRNWTPPGGWSPPPGWNPPSEWVPRLRKWGWSYIPQRGWVVPVQWTPPPDFTVPPNWYYLPTSSYNDYGFYDPSEIVVLPGRARPDLQANINVTEIYTPPAPPPAIVMNAPPPPPRPAPPQPPPVPEQITQVQNVVDVFSRPREPNAPRYDGPVLVTGSVHFEYDKYAIQPQGFPTLDAIGQALTEDMPDAIINIEGHTDADGSDEYNQKLSEQRAWSVKSYLVQKFGIDPNRLIIVGYGERAPIASNDTDTGKARNRRVEFENVTDLYSAQVVETAAPDTSPAPPATTY